VRVLHVIPAVAMRYGGPSQAIIELATALRRCGIDVEVCSTDADGSGRLPVQLDKLVTYRGNQFRFFRRDWSEAFKFSRDMQRWLGQHVADYDLVHVHAVFSHSVYAAARACQRHQVPYIVRPLGSLEPWCIRQKPVRKFLAWHLFFHRALIRATAIHYTTEQERDLCEQPLALRNGIVVPNGVEDPILDVTANGSFRRTLGLNIGTPFLLALSRLHPKKGIELLLTVFAKMKASGQLADWHLVIAGDGDARYAARLRALAESSQAARFVHWTGWLEGQNKLDVLAEADLFVLSSFQENFGIGALEAMACGTPVLVSEHVGLATDVRQQRAGWVVDLNPEDLRRGLLEATADAAELATRGAAARALVRERFTWPKIAERWSAWYAQLAGQGVIQETTLGAC
jgi:glycosyltransferase involved in cell wall biosynthesis